MAVPILENEYRHTVSTVIIFMNQTFDFRFKFELSCFLSQIRSCPGFQLFRNVFSDRIRRMHIRVRYHSGQAIQFSRFVKDYLLTPSLNPTERPLFTRSKRKFFKNFFHRLLKWLWILIKYQKLSAVKYQDDPLSVFGSTDKNISDKAQSFVVPLVVLIVP